MFYGLNKISVLEFIEKVDKQLWLLRILLFFIHAVIVFIIFYSYHSFIIYSLFCGILILMEYLKFGWAIRKSKKAKKLSNQN